MLVWLLYGLCEILKKVGAIVFLQKYGFDVAYFLSVDVDWLRFTSSWLANDFFMGEVYDVPSCSSSSTRHGNLEVKPHGDFIIPSRPVLFVTEDFTPLPTSLAHLERCFSENHLLGVLSWDGPLEVPKVDASDS